MPIKLDDLLASREPLLRAWGEPVAAPTEASRRIADDAVEGRLYFYKQVTEVGRRDIDWNGHHHQHQEWRAQLNRFTWLGPLAALYRETRDERYAGAARDYIADWIAQHPTRDGWDAGSYDSVLNLCIRMGHSQVPGWIGCLPIFMQSTAFDDAFVESIIASCHVQLNYLLENVADSINWRIANADSMLVSGIRLDFLPDAERWRERGVRIINDAWHRQILPDGVHYERNPSYHAWMTNVMASYWKLQREMPELGLVMEAELIAKMYDYALGCTRPNGSLNALHDCVGERSGTHENVALRQRAAFLEAAGLPPDLPSTRQYLPHAGQLFLRDGWNENATYITFDATLWGGSHCHLSRNAVQLHAGGSTLLPDPGYFTYEASDPFSAYGKSTRAHNTLNLNGWNQGECDPVHTRVLYGEGYDFASADYEGPYWSGRYTWGYATGRGDALHASHNRMLLWLRGRAVIVIDSLHREPHHADESQDEAPSLEVNWQLREGGRVGIEDNGARAVADYGDSNLLLLFPLRWPNLTVSLHEGEREPLRGWLPDSGGKGSEFIPAPQLCIGTNKLIEHYAEVATVLIPFTGPKAPQVRCEAHKTDGQKPASLVLRWEDGTSDELWWTYRGMIMLGTVGDIETDGGLLHLRRDANGKLISGGAVEATYVAPHDTATRRRPELIVF